MPTESLKAKQDRAQKIIDTLIELYPDAQCSLTHRDPYELLVSTILSAQCTDNRVNKVTPALFKEFPTVASMAHANKDRLIELIRSTGFFNNKSKNILACTKMIMEKFDGKVPGNMDDLVSLPGVGRKTANVVLGEIFHIPGVVVDTHVGRISRHLGLTISKDAVKVEFDLMKILPKEYWTLYNHMIIDHGRAICKSRKPDCEHCGLRHLCPGPADN